MYTNIVVLRIQLKSKNPAYCWIFIFQMAEEYQLPSQLAQGMRLKIKTKPTAYIM
jgi:hypothetical protein